MPHTTTTTDDELCGLPGDSDVGYCRCTRPKEHPPGEHGCQHGAWW